MVIFKFIDFIVRYITPIFLRFNFGIDGSLATAFTETSCRLVTIYNPEDRSTFYTTFLQDFASFKLVDKSFEHESTINSITFEFYLHQKKANEKKEYERHLAQKYNFSSPPTILKNEENSYIISLTNQKNDMVILHIVANALVCIFLVPRQVDYQEMLNMMFINFGSVDFYQLLNDESDSSSLRSRSSSNSSENSINSLSFDEISQHTDYSSIPAYQIGTDPLTEKDTVLSQLTQISRALNYQPNLKKSLSERFKIKFNNLPLSIFQELCRLKSENPTEFEKLIVVFNEETQIKLL